MTNSAWDFSNGDNALRWSSTVWRIKFLSKIYFLQLLNNSDRITLPNDFSEL
ncbi:MAG: hypothetical protein Ct9H300mP28_19260 [Pseudomonadota bacterium]|nr:MAG: hypothetical protein Ct9H300mP28_19260 [Pseudomonadota bacterium]